MLEAKKPWLSIYRDRLSGEPLGGSLTAFLEEAVEKYRDNTALTRGEQKISYGELLDLTESFAAALYEAGVQKDDRVGLMLPNCPEYVVAFFGTMRIGATVTQVNPIYVGRELTHIFDNSGLETVIVHSMMYEKAKAIQADTPLKRIICVDEPVGGLKDGDVPFDEFLQSAAGGMPEVEIDPQKDLSSLQYTGGTTGISKGAMLTHANLLGGVKQTMDLLIEDSAAFPENGKVIAVAPFFHIFGMTMVLLFGLRMGWNLLTVPRFQPGVVMEMIRDEEPVMLPGVATIFVALHNYPDMENYGLDKVELYTSGGASVPLGLLRSFERRAGQLQHLPPGIGGWEHRRAYTRHRRARRGHRNGGERNANRRAGRARRKGPSGDEGLLEHARGDREDPERWLALHRRHRPDGRRLPLHRG